jgi:hypothetical protein
VLHIVLSSLSVVVQQLSASLVSLELPRSLCSFKCTGEPPSQCVFCLYFSSTACKLGHFLSREEWLAQMGLFWLYVESIMQLIHLCSCGIAEQSLSLYLTAQRGHVSSPLQSRNLWLYLEHLRHVYSYVVLHFTY